ncbi:ComEC/Rec2 family competence protein [Aliamphritea spongicola]|nr:ComEC/Rec2 family competence protein [Aliamphritea spongicola]
MGCIQADVAFSAGHFCRAFPILLIFTGNVSLISPLVNIVAIPYISLIVLPALVVIIMLVALGLTGLSVMLAEELLSLFWRGLAWGDDLLNQSGFIVQAEEKLTEHFTPEPEYLLLAVVGIGLLLLPQVFPFRIIGAVLCLPLLFGRGILFSREISKPGCWMWGRGWLYWLKPPSILCYLIPAPAIPVAALLRVLLFRLREGPV